MSSAMQCPEPAELAAHARNDLPVQATTTLDQHLTVCRPCLNRYLELKEPQMAPDIPNYRIVKEIGRGRFGVVYKAWSLSDRPRVVALKVMGYGGEMEKTRFEREIAALRRIDSPGIVKCLESNVTGENHYYVMDYVEGVHLDEYLRPADDLLKRLEVFQRICRAVADAHAEGVIHRDLKPSNILVDAQNHPHILDFGICALEQNEWGSRDKQTVTLPGDVIGTLKYMSPEQAWGGIAGPVDERGDVWALGVMLYEIVTDGHYPYSLNAEADKPAHEALLERIRKELPRLPRLDALARGRDLEVLLERCLAWEPDRRMRSAAALADDLARYVRGERIKTRPLGLPYRLKRLAVGAATRSRGLFWTAFVAAVALVIGGSAWLFNVGWHGTVRQIHGRDPLAASIATPDQARDWMTIVGVSSDTVAAIMQFAKERGIPGVTPRAPSWRTVHGRLMHRLATARPLAVVWDYYCQSPQEGDAEFVAGLEACESAGVPVVLAAAAYDADGSPELSPGIVGTLGNSLRHGAIDVRDPASRPGEFIVAMKRSPDAVVPSLALTTLAAVLHPPCRLEIEWPNRRSSLNLLYRIRPGAYLRGRDRIELTRAILAGGRQTAVHPEALLACNRFSLRKPDYWARRVVPYERLLTCPDEELLYLVENRVLIVGDLQESRFGLPADRHQVRYGATVVDEVPGCFLLADATANLLGGGYLIAAFPLDPWTFVVVLLLAVVGCLLPIRLTRWDVLERPHHRRWLWTVLGTAATAGFFAMVLTKDAFTVHAGMAAMAFVLPTAGSFWVEFVRNRHRLLDRGQQAIGDHTRISDGTITLVPPPR